MREDKKEASKIHSAEDHEATATQSSLVVALAVNLIPGGEKVLSTKVGGCRNDRGSNLLDPCGDDLREHLKAHQAKFSLSGAKNP